MAYINKINVGGNLYDISLPQSIVDEGLQIKDGKLSLRLGTGLIINADKEVSVIMGSGFIESKNSENLGCYSLYVGDGFNIGDGKLEFKLGSGLKLVDGELTLNIGVGLEFDTDGALRIPI